MKRVKVKGVPVVVHKPTLDAPEFFGGEVTRDSARFKAECDVVAANRWSDDFVRRGRQSVHVRLVREGLTQKGSLLGDDSYSIST